MPMFAIFFLDLVGAIVHAREPYNACMYLDSRLGEAHLREWIGVGVPARLSEAHLLATSRLKNV